MGMTECKHMENNSSKGKYISKMGSGDFNHCQVRQHRQTQASMEVRSHSFNCLLVFP